MKRATTKTMIQSVTSEEALKILHDAVDQSSQEASSMYRRGELVFHLESDAVILQEWAKIYSTKYNTPLPDFAALTKRQYLDRVLWRLDEFPHMYDLKTKAKVNRAESNLAMWKRYYKINNTEQQANPDGKPRPTKERTLGPIEYKRAQAIFAPAQGLAPVLRDTIAALGPSLRKATYSREEVIEILTKMINRLQDDFREALASVKRKARAETRTSADILREIAA